MLTHSILPLLVAGLLLTSCSSETSKLDERIAQGAEIVSANCFVCHGQAINGAPMIGNPKMWNDRVSQGEDTLKAHAREGYGMMPARGGNPKLTDEQIAMAVEYMLNELE